MAYTEIKERNKRKYYYRVRSVRHNNKVSKKRIYLGCNLSKKELAKKEAFADGELTKEKESRYIKKIKPRILDIMKKRGIKKAGIFGSYARGEQKKNSDVDILIEPADDMGFFEIVEMEDELRKVLRKRIDLLTYAGIHKILKNKILKEEIRII